MHQVKNQVLGKFFILLILDQIDQDQEIKNDKEEINKKENIVVKVKVQVLNLNMIVNMLKLK